MANSVGKGFPTTNLQVGHIFCDIDDLTLWQYLGGDPRLVTSWRLTQGQVNSHPDTTLWGLSQAGARWFYGPEQTYYGWDGSQVVQIVSSQGQDLYNYRTMFSAQDDFITGLASSGGIGKLGWLTAGTSAAQASEANRPGIMRIDTGAVSGTTARISASNSSAFDPALDHTLTWIARCNTPDANTLMRIGAGSSVAANPPNNGIYFEKLDADTTWFAVIRASAAPVDRINTLVPVNTSFKVFTHVMKNNVVTFFINYQQVATIPVTTFNATISPYGFILNSAAAAKTFDVDYFGMDARIGVR
jgi:hypothetical protein